MYYFLLFMIYSFFGWCFECIHMAITTKEIINRGFLNGPYIPIYGVGLTLITVLLSNFKSNFMLLLLLSILIIGVLEYFVSYILEKIFKIRWWDYSNRKFNLNGRICLNTMCIFISGAMIIIYLIHPVIEQILTNMTNNTIVILFVVLLIILLIDVIISVIFTIKFLKNKNKSERLDKTPEIKFFIKNFFNKKCK